MQNIYRSLLLIIAGATQQELARQIKYLKFENEILRSRLVSIVHPGTLLRWKREDRKAKGNSVAPKRGRPRTAEQLRRLILKLVRENEWGYLRIMGELKKLGIKPPLRNTVKNILKEKGLDPGPQRVKHRGTNFSNGMPRRCGNATS